MGSYFVHPSEYIAITFKFTHVFKNFDEGVLQNIIGIFVINHNFSNMPVKPFLIISK